METDQFKTGIVTGIVTGIEFFPAFSDNLNVSLVAAWRSVEQSMTDRAMFRTWVRWLRAKFPSEIPVRVYLRPISGTNLGECHLKEEPFYRIVIFVSDKLSNQSTLDTLFEEWAHALRFHTPNVGNPSAHDSVYGAIFNQIKQQWLGETTNQ